MFLLLIALISNHGSSQMSVGYQTRAQCESERARIVQEFKKDGAPGWSGEGGIIVKSICTEVGK